MEAAVYPDGAIGRKNKELMASGPASVSARFTMDVIKDVYGEDVKARPTRPLNKWEIVPLQDSTRVSAIVELLSKPRLG